MLFQQMNLWTMVWFVPLTAIQLNVDPMTMVQKVCLLRGFTSKLVYQNKRMVSKLVKQHWNLNSCFYGQKIIARPVKKKHQHLLLKVQMKGLKLNWLFPLSGTGKSPSIILILYHSHFRKLSIIPSQKIKYKAFNMGPDSGSCKISLDHILLIFNVVSCFQWWYLYRLSYVCSYLLPNVQ